MEVISLLLIHLLIVVAVDAANLLRDALARRELLEDALTANFVVTAGEEESVVANGRVVAQHASTAAMAGRWHQIVKIHRGAARLLTQHACLHPDDDEKVMIPVGFCANKLFAATLAKTHKKCALEHTISCSYQHPESFSNIHYIYNYTYVSKLILI